METFFPGTRVLVFDPSIYYDDISTPNCIKPATVVCWYASRSTITNLVDESLIDVIFDHRPDRISRAHFTYCVEVLDS